MKSLIFHVEFSLDGTRYRLLARDVDMTVPYFVCIKQLEWKPLSSKLILSTEDESEKRFKNCEVVYVPATQIVAIQGYEESKYFEINPPLQATVTALKST